MPLGRVKHDAMLKFGQGRSRVTEAAGSHSILTWLITAVVDGVALLTLGVDVCLNLKGLDTTRSQRKP